MEKRNATLAFRTDSMGFMIHQIEGDTATVQYINENGEILYYFTKTNPRTEYKKSKSGQTQINKAQMKIFYQQIKCIY